MANHHKVTLRTDKDGRTILSVDGTRVLIALPIHIVKASTFSTEEVAETEEHYPELDW